MARFLKITNTGDDVRDVQRRLGVKVDGVFGSSTARAVLQFQADRGLSPDGVVGPKTWEALNALVEVEPQIATPAPEADERDVIPDWGTAGPLREHDPGSIDADGWYTRARRVDAHPGRIGGTIEPKTLVIHTTDMPEDTFDALVKSWATRGGGMYTAAAHFIIGRTPAQGVVQMVGTGRNGNHAGGSRIVDGKSEPFHGWYRLKDGKLVHPNLWAVGVELHNAGRLGKRTVAGFVHPDSKRIIPDDEVFLDSHGVGWHKVTDYQLEELGLLIAAARAKLGKIPGGVTIVPNGSWTDNGVQWAQPSSTVQIVGHVTLDPTNKTDPGPQVLAWLNQLG